MNVKNIIKNIISTRWKLILSISVLAVLSIGAIITTPLIMRHLINIVTDSVLIGENTIEPGVLVFWTTLLIVFIAISFIAKGQMQSKMLAFGNELTTDLSNNTYSSVLRSEQLDINKFDKELILNSIVEKSSKIGNEYVGKNLLNFFYELLLLSAIIITLLAINPIFALATMVTLPLFHVATQQITKLIDKRQEIKNDLSRKKNLLLRDNLDQIKNIKLLNGVREEEVKYSNLLDRHNKVDMQINSLSNYNNGLIANLLTGIILAFVVGYGVYVSLLNGIGENDLGHLGTIVATLILIPQTFPLFRSLMDTEFRPSYIADEVETINDFLTLKPENRGDSVQQLDEIYSLKFKDVSFDYGRDTKFTMADLNFEIKKGEKLGVLGLSSSGKTTLADLFTKIVRVKQGSITINNCDINKINTYYLRDLIAVVPQDAKLFYGTIEENIRYPHGFDEYKYNDALNRCRLKSVINTLDKRDKTIVDVNSTLLTPAEVQKVAIANALYKDSKIVLLDDATSKMDQNTEQEIIDEVYKLKNKIIIMISNRIHNLTKCDKIMILNNGRIIEYGKTEELLDNKKSTFAKMMSEYEVTKTRVG